MSSSAWIVALIGTFMLSGVIGGAFHTEFKLPGTESQAAFDLLQQSSFRDRQVQGQIVFKSESGVTIRPSRAPWRGCSPRSSRTIANVTVVSPYSEAGARQIGPNNPNVAYAEVNFADRSNEAFQADGKKIKELGDQIDVPGLEIDYGGDMFATNPLNGVTEAIGLLAAMVILLIAFGSVLAMGLPIGTALFGIGTGVAIVLMLRTILDMPDFTTAAVAMVGIGVGHRLRAVHRHALPREPRRRSRPRTQRRARDRHRRPRGAVRRLHRDHLRARPVAHEDVDHARRVDRDRGRRAHHHARVDHAAARAARVRRAQHRQVEDRPPQARGRRAIGSRRWYRWSRVIQQRPWPALIIGFVVLLVLTMPLLSLRLGFTDAGNRPTSDTTRRAYDLVSEGFGPGFNGPLLLAAATPER